MARISAFRAIFPAKGMENKVSANTHLQDLRAQIEEVRNNPYTYLNVVKPYLRFNEEKDPEKHFPYAHAALHELLAMKAISRDSIDSLYIYSQHNLLNGRQYKGLICTVPVKDYYDGKIKIHEKTITEKENQLIRHIDISGVIGEPVLLTHHADKAVTDLLSRIESESTPDIEFTDASACKHSIRKLIDPLAIEAFRKAYADAGDLYIADGHHRSAASAGYFKGKNNLQGHYLACIVAPEYLHIDSFHRAYKADASIDVNHFIDALQQNFDCRSSDAPVSDPGEHEFGMLLGGHWYKLRFKHNLSSASAVDKLDVSILEEYVFRQVLGIEDSKTDRRLSFLKGSVPCSELETEVKAGMYDLVFILHPCSIEQVFEVADQQLIMPPKSTYIEPKLLTGLSIQSVED